MNFKFEWSIREEGNYAIRKRGKGAGKEIELNTKQTSDTHFFLLVDNTEKYETMRDLRKINEILKTIEYKYIYKGTEKQSNTKYLTQKDIEDVIKNIETYKDKTITIETADSKLKQLEEGNKWNKLLKKIEKEFENLPKDPKSKKESIEKLLGKNNFEKVLELLGNNLDGENEFKTEGKDAKIQIRFHNKRIQEIKDKLAKTETRIKAEKENREYNVFNLFFGKTSKFDYNEFKKREKYKTFLQTLDIYYKLAKAKQQGDKQKEIQNGYRERENIKKGKTKRKYHKD